MKTLTGISLVLVIVLVSLSAYLRLAHSGIGCAEWPACYGRIGAAEVSTPLASPAAQAARDAYQRIIATAEQPLAWATPLHRLVASVLGIAVLILNLMAFRQRRHRLTTLALLALTVWLALLGIRSGSLHDPAVVMGNLAGGFAMLGLLGWLWFKQAAALQPPGTQGSKTGLVVMAIALLATQILLGGLTSANFAATSCRTLPDCHGGWWPGKELIAALDLSRAHAVTASGQAIGGPERIAIHQVHRLGALATLALVFAAGLLAIRGGSRQRNTGSAILLLVAAEFSVGIFSVLYGLPIALAVAHNWLAGLLLLALLRLLHLQGRRPRPLRNT
ncbi:MAG TPA: COX15/CtaA family protein [Xanthomonadales bacterium]|nr:COX15/CtaA family protein [Xanthomonadales bacterium]